MGHVMCHVVIIRHVVLRHVVTHRVMSRIRCINTRSCCDAHGLKGIITCKREDDKFALQSYFI